MRDARIANLEALAREAFARHGLKMRRGDVAANVPECAAWFICAPDHGNHAAEIVLCGFRSILVHGDCPDVLFQGGDGGPAVDRLCWLAASELDYLASKVRAGEKRTWDEDIARHDIQRTVDECERDTCSAETRCPRCAALLDALDDAEGAIDGVRQRQRDRLDIGVPPSGWERA